MPSKNPWSVASCAGTTDTSDASRILPNSSMNCLENLHLHRQGPSGSANGGSDGGNRRGRGRGQQGNLFRPPFRLVDPALPVALGQVDGLLAFSFRHVDPGLLVGDSEGNLGALLSLGFHLLLERFQHLQRWGDVLDLVAQHLDAPRIGRPVDLLDDGLVDVLPFRERLLQSQLSDFRTHRRLGQVDGGPVVVGDAIAGLVGIDDLQEDETIHLDLDVVLGNAALRRYVDYLLATLLTVGQTVDERDQQVESRLEDGGELAESFLHHLFPGGHDQQRVPQHKDRNHDEHRHGRTYHLHVRPPMSGWLRGMQPVVSIVARLDSPPRDSRDRGIVTLAPGGISAASEVAGQVVP